MNGGMDVPPVHLPLQRPAHRRDGHAMMLMYSSLMADMIGIDCDPFGSVAFARRFGFDGVDLRLDRFAHVFDDEAAVARFRDELSRANLRPGYCSILPGKISCDEAEWVTGMKRLPDYGFNAVAEKITSDGWILGSVERGNGVRYA